MISSATVTVQDIASAICNSFDPTQSVKIEEAIVQSLCAQGYSAYDAAEEAEQKIGKVLRTFRAKRPEELPFHLSPDEQRLIGNQRVLKTDSPQTQVLRSRLQIVPLMIKALYDGGPDLFEKICAGVMLLSGAHEVFAGCTNDDGGIDIHGRIQLRVGDIDVREGLLQTALLQKEGGFLFLGQCKCYKLDGSIGPDAISEFDGSVRDCLRKYEGNDRPPSHRLADNYYKKDEACIRVFFTTATYSDKASSKAKSLDIIAVTGHQLAEFLVYHGVGLVESDGNQLLDPIELAKWALPY